MGFDILHEGKRSVNALAQVDLVHGDLVKFMSTAAYSGNEAYETQLEVGSVAVAADANICGGINIGSVTSGNMATIYLDGIYVKLSGAASCDPGERVIPVTDPQAVGPEVLGVGSPTIGRFLTAAASTEEVVVELNF